MDRYQHYIQSVKGNVYPKHIICIGVDPCSVCGTWCGGCPGSDPLRSQALILTSPDYDVDIRHSQSCPGSDDIIHVLDHMSRGSRDIWVVTRHTANLWLRCDLWAAIESERISLSTHTSTRRATPDDSHIRRPDTSPTPARTISASLLRRLRERGMGYVNIGNPPCIARFLLPVSGGWCTWVDLDNYGLDRNIVAIDAGGQAAKIAAQMRQYITVLRTNDMGSLQTTIAAQSWYGFRRSYKRYALYVHQHRGASEIEEDACHGGRTECYHIGALDMPLWYVDVRAMYASIGQECMLPSALMTHTKDKDACHDLVYMCPNECIAKVTLCTDWPAYPCRTECGTVYPTGKYTTCLAGPELGMAVEHGVISEIIAVARYRMHRILETYMQKLLTARQWAAEHGDAIAEGVCKRLCNAVTGKFAQRNQCWEARPDIIPPVQYGTWYGSDHRGSTCKYRAIAGHTEMERCREYAPNAMPSVYAFITAYGRCLMWEMMSAAGLDHIYYVATDGLIVDEYGFGNLIASNHLVDGRIGKLQVRQQAQHAHIYGINQYTLGDQTVIAGVPHAHIRGTGNDGKYQYVEPVHVCIRQGKRPGSLITWRRFATPNDYVHGTVLPSGRVMPIHYM